MMMAVVFGTGRVWSALACVVVMLGSIGLSGPTLAQAGSEEARLAAAERYERAAPVRLMIDRMMDEVEQIAPPEARANVRQFLRDDLDVGQIRILYVHALAEAFTAPELNALADFYGSPTGNAILQKMPRFMGGAMPMIQGEVLRGLERYQRRHGLQ